MSLLLSKLSFLCRKSLWLPMGRYLARAQLEHSKIPGRMKSRLPVRFKYNRLSPISQTCTSFVCTLHIWCRRAMAASEVTVNRMISLLRPVLIAPTVAPASHRVRLQDNLGGGALSLTRTYSFAQLSSHLVAGSLEQGKEQGKESVFRYAVHVDDHLEYPSPAYIHCKIPLEKLLSMLPVAHARKIIMLHGSSPGSRCTQKHLLMSVENHSCHGLRCNSYFTVFSVEKSPRQLGSKRAAKYKASKILDEASKKKPDATSTKKPDAASTYEFPPDPADASLANAILSNACKKMQPKYLQEGGCAVCGELKPVRELSRLKGIKNILSVLEAPGVTRVERKTPSSLVKGYAGPVLDHACSQVCEGCRATIRKNKVPRLALANNLWIGKVPEALKNLRYVEKILVAKVRHTCAYVKVASGMRKMKANVVAFESPVPKIYAVLPPPREDIEEVLAILFTGPSKPTPEDFARTPFLVR